MTDIIFKMRGDLREILRESVVDYPSKAREKWIFDWPSQIILVVNQIYWCQEVEEAFMKLNKGQSNAMKVSSTSLVFNALLRQNVRGTHNMPASAHQDLYCISHKLRHVLDSLTVVITGIQPVPSQAVDQAD